MFGLLHCDLVMQTRGTKRCFTDVEVHEYDVYEIWDIIRGSMDAVFASTVPNSDANVNAISKFLMKITDIGSIGNHFPKLHLNC